MPRPRSPLTTFILSLPRDLPVSEVIDQARAKGFDTDEKNVSRVRGMASTKPAKKTASKRPPRRPWPRRGRTPRSRPRYRQRLHPQPAPRRISGRRGRDGEGPRHHHLRQPRAQGPGGSGSEQRSEEGPGLDEGPRSRQGSQLEVVEERLHPPAAPDAFCRRGIVAKGKQAGLNFAANLVYTVQSRASAKTVASPKKAAASKNVTAPEETSAPGTAKSAGVSKSEFIRLHPASRRRR